jgi:hypothetical protein
MPQAAQQLEVQTSNIREHGALFQHVTPGETKIFSALSLPSVAFALPVLYSSSLPSLRNYKHALLLLRSFYCWFTTRSVQIIVCPAVDAVYHITQILLDFTDTQSGFRIPLPWFG